MAELEAVIGLEIHVQLATRTKMFCGCELSFGDEPNVHTCPVCLAHPGVLPVVNEQAILYALQIAAALDARSRPRSIFHRKNYFYPDSPKAYQISQYDIPIAGAGRLGDVRIHRAHLEEDAAKMIHVGESGRIHGSGASLVDFNRGGTPLVEIVTEPDLRGAAEAAEWARLLRETVRQLGVSDVNMEEGSLRVDANVSVRPAGSRGAGDEDRAEEHEQLPLPPARGRSRARAPARADRGGGDGRTGDPPLRPGQRQPHLAALEGGSPRLPLLPRARPGAAGADRGRCCARPARRCRSCRRRGSSATWGSWAWPTTSPLTLADRPRDRRLLRACRRRRRGRRAEGRRQLGHRRAGGGAAPGRRGGRAPPTPRSSPRRWPR